MEKFRRMISGTLLIRHQLKSVSNRIKETENKSAMTAVPVKNTQKSMSASLAKSDKSNSISASVLMTGETPKSSLMSMGTSTDTVLVTGELPNSSIMSMGTSTDTVLVTRELPNSSIMSTGTSTDTVLMTGELPKSSIMSTGTSTDTVLVTGGSGFLGEHIVKLLQEKADHVKEIRILDLKPYKNILDYKQCKPIKTIQGSITDLDVVQRACQGVTTVYHVAGLISYGVFPDINGMKQVNIEGTKNVIDGCIRAGVQRLIYCSTVDVAIGYDPIRDGNEDNTPPPKRFLFPGYPETKYKAECLVLQSNGRTSTLGRKLETLALRVNVLYGEGDPYYVTTGLIRAYKSNNVLYRVGNGQAKFQQTYVGNAAWAFICADNALRNNLTPGGTVYYIPDNTPIQNTFDFFQPFLECRQLRLSKMAIPFCLAYGGLYLVEVILHLISPFKKVYYQEASCSVRYICTDLYFSGEKARRMLGYTPLISPNEAISRSLVYYQNINLEANQKINSDTKNT